MKKKVGQTKALCVVYSSISSSTLPADMSVHFQSRKTHISAYYNIINNAILSSNTFDIVCMNDYEPPYTKRYAHLKWLSNVAFLFDVLKFQMKKRITGSTLIFVVKVPVDYSEKSERYTRELTQAIITINTQTPVVYHAANLHLNQGTTFKISPQ